MKLTFFGRVFLAVLALANLLQLPSWGQVPQVGLRIVIVEGEGAVNNIRQRVNRDPIVQVEDENRRPVAGAIVTFFLPDTGPSGTFVNGARTLTLTTDAQGRATAVGIRPNNQTGTMQIRVTASFQGQTASAVINQTNAVGAATGGGAAGGGMSATMKAVLIMAIAGGAAAGVAVATTRNGGGAGASVPTITLTPGTPTVGGPR
jgi:hypothetical protein